MVLYSDAEDKDIHNASRRHIVYHYNIPLHFLIIILFKRRNSVHFFLSPPIKNSSFHCTFQMTKGPLSCDFLDYSLCTCWRHNSSLFLWAKAFFSLIKVPRMHSFSYTARIPGSFLIVVYIYVSYSCLVLHEISPNISITL